MRILLIHNPKAGYEQADAPKLMELIRSAGHAPVYQSSELDDVSAALEEKWDLVVVAGGDGTVTRLLRQCTGRDVTLALLPLGTANNVATALGYTGTLEHLVGAWSTAAARTLDLGVASAAWGRSGFAEGFGAGLLAQMIVAADKGDEEKARTKFRTVAERLDAGMKAMRKTLKGVAAVPMTLRTPQAEHAGEFLWAEVTTVGLVGPRLPLVDLDDPADGLLTYALLPAENREAFMEFLEHKQGGSAPTRTGLVTGRAAEMELRWSGAEAHLDGRLLSRLVSPAVDQRVEVRVRPAAVRVLRPGAAAT